MFTVTKKMTFHSVIQWLCFLFCAFPQVLGQFYVAAPNIIRLGAEETVAVIHDKANPQNVNLFLQDYPGKKRRFSPLSFDVQSGKSEIVRIRVTQSDIPDAVFTDPNVRNYVALVVQSTGFNKEVVIPVSPKSGYVFIQTDKPIYTPNQNVNIRIIPLTERALPSEEEFKLQIRNPQNVIVSEELLNTGQGANRKAFISEVFQFPSDPVTGEWTISAFYGIQFQHNSTVKFQVKHYVLPTFSLKLNTPDVVLPNFKEITGHVTAEYVYKKKLKGHARFMFGVKDVAGNIVYFGKTKSIQLKNGVAEFRIRTDEIKNHRSVGWFPQISGSTLVVEVNVTDSGTGKQEVAISQNGKFSESPYVISFKRSLRDFKPGLVSVVEADVNYANGMPAPGVKVAISAVVDGRTPLKITTREAISDEEGKVSFLIHPEVQHSTVTVTLRTDDPKFGIYQATGTHTQQKFISRNGGYLAIARKSVKTLKPDSIFAEDLYVEPPGQISDIYYMVVSRGVILLMNKLPKGNFKIQKVQFQVTYAMAPSFRLVVFAHHKNELIADSLQVDVSNVCAPNAQVTLEPEFDEEIVAPGSNGKIVITGTKNTLVGLLAVDEAVYVLRNKDLLTKSKMFKTMASHDLGCGPGGGGNTNTVIGNAGVVLMTSVFTPPPDLQAVPACEIKARRRRDDVNVLSMLLQKYKGKKCCKMALSQGNRNSIQSCYDEVDGVVKRYAASSTEKDECRTVFLNCCLTIVQTKNNIANNARGRNVDDYIDELMFTEIANEAEEENLILLRSDFTETWIFQDRIIGSDNKAEMDVSVPHSITTWVIQAVSVSNQYGMCVAEPKNVVVFQNIFLELNLPYSVVKNEQVEIQATVFNYGARKLPVTVYMYGVKGICSGAHEGQKSERKRIYVQPNSAQTVSFPIIPLKIGEYKIKVAALSSYGSDFIEKKLNVVPAGYTFSKQTVIKLDPTNQQKRGTLNVTEGLYRDFIDVNEKRQIVVITLRLPKDAIPGTESCAITAIGDEFGPVIETSLQNPDDLIRLPHGCGEQNMIYLGPTMYTMRYLKVTGKMSKHSEKNGYNFLRRGYQNQLKYRRDDGSFSAWGKRRNPSVWLTAFVMKIFCQASSLVYIDPNVMCSGLTWLRNIQQADGSFSDNHPVISRDITGGVRGRATMTAFVLIALHECKCDDLKLELAQARAVSYLESHLGDLTQPLETAIAAYAMQLSNSDLKNVIFGKLQAIERYNAGWNTLHWTTGRGTEDIEATSYGLLTYLLRKDMIKSNSIVNWLNNKRLASGSFPSTQDTVMALQALSEYAIAAKSLGLSLETTITYSKDSNLKKTFIFRDEKALVPEHLKVEKFGGELFVHTKGYGIGLLTVDLKYSLPSPPEDMCKFDIKLTVTEVNQHPRLRIDNDVAGGNDGLTLNLKICVRYKGKRPTGMSIVDAGIFSGFVANEQDLRNLVNCKDHLVDSYEITSRSVVIYLEKVPTENYCFAFRVNQEFKVGNTQMSVMRVYDYYNPEESCTQFYSPDENSATLLTICDNGICQCAEGGCPPKDPFKEMRQLKDELLDINENSDVAREELLKMACDKNDYVWKGKPKEIVTSGGFIRIKFRIETVIKAGIERKESLVGKERELMVGENCGSASLVLDSSYLIMGKDEEYPGTDGKLWYRYLLDQSSVIHRWFPWESAPDKFLQKSLNQMEKLLLTDGCHL